MNAEKIKELRGLVAGGTPLPWRTAASCDFNEEWEVCDCGGPSDAGGEVKVVADQQDYCMAAEDDAALIVAAVNALPALLDEVEALRARQVTSEMVLDAKLLMEVCAIRSERSDADSTDVTIAKRAQRHWEQVTDAARHEPKDDCSLSDFEMDYTTDYRGHERPEPKDAER